MNRPWLPEIAVTVDRARQLIASRFPLLAGRPVTEFANGWDNTGFLVDGTWVFRFPRRRIAITLLECEIRCLPWLAPRLPLAVPLPEFIALADAAHPHPFAGYRLIPGTTACRAGLGDAARMALAGPLAGFLRALHDIPVAELRGFDAPGDALRRLDVAYRAAGTLGRITDLERRGDATASEADALRTLVADAGTARPASGGTLVHGDLYARHLVVDEAGALRGIIDWGDMHLGDPAMDLMVAFLVLPAAARRRFFARYGAIDEDTRRLARFRAVEHVGHLCVFAHDTADLPLLAEMRRAVGHLLDG